MVGGGNIDMGDCDGMAWKRGLREGFMDMGSSYGMVEWALGKR